MDEWQRVGAGARVSAGRTCATFRTDCHSVQGVPVGAPCGGSPFLPWPPTELADGFGREEALPAPSEGSEQDSPQYCGGSPARVPRRDDDSAASGTGPLVGTRRPAGLSQPNRRYRSVTIPNSEFLPVTLLAHGSRQTVVRRTRGPSVSGTSTTETPSSRSAGRYWRPGSPISTSAPAARAASRNGSTRSVIARS
jgi:hypothetical protein